MKRQHCNPPTVRSNVKGVADIVSRAFSQRRPLPLDSPKRAPAGSGVAENWPVRYKTKRNLRKSFFVYELG